MLKVNELNKKVTGSSQKNKSNNNNLNTKEMNTQILKGWTGTNAATTTTSNGNKKAYFRLATHETNDNGEELTRWHNVAAWNKNAEKVEGLRAGTPVEIECYERNHIFTAINGKQRTFTELVIVKIF